MTYVANKVYVKCGKLIVDGDSYNYCTTKTWVIWNKKYKIRRSIYLRKLSCPKCKDNKLNEICYLCNKDYFRFTNDYCKHKRVFKSKNEFDSYKLVEAI
jgi:hypothetical protein